jgi:pimeloyl-ACP methyl ester carboxylesterase
MIRSIFSRDGHPGIYDPAMVEALVADRDEIRRHDSGRHLYRHGGNLPMVDPAKVKSPVLMTRGEWDGNSTDADLLDFFRQLPNGDRQYVILPNTAHSEGFQQEPANAVVRDEEFPRRTGAGGELKTRQRDPHRETYRSPEAGPSRCHAVA